jgi:hypothetical protein
MMDNDSNLSLTNDNISSSQWAVKYWLNPIFKSIIDSFDRQRAN